MKLTEPKTAARSLAEIFEDDDLGLLIGEAKKSTKSLATPASPVVSNFLEIVTFYEDNGHLPDMSNSSEKRLAVRLNAYRMKENLAAQVREYDSYGILKEVQKSEPAAIAESGRNVASLDDIFNDDDLGLLDGSDNSIFNLEHITPKEAMNRETPDEIGRRRPCTDFWRYERLFNQIRAVLHTDAVTIRKKFSFEETVRTKSVFILRGQLCYVDSIVKHGATKEGRDDPRIHVVFDNGTEIDILKRSLMKALGEDKNSRYLDLAPSLLSENSATITDRDRATGFIYILGTLSKAPELARLKTLNQLVKIGYTTQSVDERIQGAEKDPTYLCAHVVKLAQLDCFNLNPQKFENLIHAFLNSQRLSVVLKDTNGQTYHPKEWFTVSLETALETCKRIIDGTIVRYRLDKTSGRIVKKNA